MTWLRQVWKRLWEGGGLVIRSTVGVLIVALLLAGATGCASSGVPVGASLPTVPLPTPATMTRHGVTYHVMAVAPAAAMHDAAHPNTVQIFVFRSENSSDPRCSQVAPRARVAGENQRSVFVATFAYATPSTGKVGCTYVASAHGPPYARLTLHLPAALGSRTLVDVKTGGILGISEGQQSPRPSWMPRGYRQSLAQPFGLEAGFVAIRQYQAGTRTVEIRLRSATAWAQDGSVVDTVDIAGRKATVTDQSYERCLTWTDNENLIREVCSLHTNANYLSTSQLTRIAQSLHS